MLSISGLVCLVSAVDKETQLYDVAYLQTESKLHICKAKLWNNNLADGTILHVNGTISGEFPDFVLNVSNYEEISIKDGSNVTLTILVTAMGTYVDKSVKGSTYDSINKTNIAFNTKLILKSPKYAPTDGHQIIVIGRLVDFKENAFWIDLQQFSSITRLPVEAPSFSAASPNKKMKFSVTTVTTPKK
jgi:hypothetical protein